MQYVELNVFFFHHFSFVAHWQSWIVLLVSSLAKFYSGLRGVLAAYRKWFFHLPLQTTMCK
jgi:hypothetical protein